MDLYTKLLSQTDHTARLLLDSDNWEQAKDLAFLQAEAERVRQAAELAEAQKAAAATAKEREREAARLKEEERLRLQASQQGTF